MNQRLPIETAFRQWADQKNYGLAVEICPFSTEDGYFGAMGNEEVISEFVDDHPEYEDEKDALYCLEDLPYAKYPDDLDDPLQNKTEM